VHQVGFYYTDFIFCIQYATHENADALQYLVSATAKTLQYATHELLKL